VTTGPGLLTAEVLFATIAAGGGHLATAQALTGALERESGGRLRARVSDVMAEYGARDLDRRHKSAWREMLARPQLVRVGQRLADAVPSVTRALQNALLDGFARSVAVRLNAEAPRLIVVNHGWLATAFTRARTRFGLASPVVIFATEPFDASALWSTPAAETVLAPSAAAKSDLVDLGVPAKRVLVCGYPVAKRFVNAPTRAEARSQLGLDDAFTCLLSLGAEGVTGGDAVGSALRLVSEGVQVIAVCGRNEALRARLLAEARATAAGPAAAGSSPVDPAAARLHVHGFAADMEVLLAASDVVAGKAGPASTMEALAVGRPVLAAAYAGLNERAVIRFLEAYGLGDFTSGYQGLPAAVMAWRDDERRREAAARVARSFGFDSVLAGLGRFLVALAEPEPSSAVSPTTADLLRPGPWLQVTRERLGQHPRRRAKPVRATSEPRA